MKNWISCCLLCFMVLHARGQQNNGYWSSQRFRGGPILGLNFSQVDGDDDAGVHKLGLQAGLGSYVSLSERLGIQLDLLYSQKGSRYAREMESTAGPYFMVYKLKLHYIELPLALQFYIDQDIHIGAGVAYNRLINSEESWRSLYGWATINAQDYPFEQDVWEYFASASYRLSDRIRAEIRYQRSATPLRKREHVYEHFGNGRNQLNNFLSLRLGYYL